MQKLLLRASFFLAIISLVITSCEKGDDGPAVKTKTELLSQSSWKYETATAGGMSIDGNVPACLKDNIVVFAANGTATVDESSTVCTPTSYAGSYTWSFQNGETQIQLSQPIFPGGSNTFTVVSLTETNLVVSQMMTIAPFPATTVEVKFKH